MCVTAGVPVSAPVLALNDAQLGLFVMVNASVWPGFTSFAVGVNEYATPTFTVVAGVPVIVGAVFTTVIENAGSAAVPPLPSLTPITMLFVVPASAGAGVPARLPLLAVKVAQVGLFWIVYVSASPSGSLPVGVNE